MLLTTSLIKQYLKPYNNAESNKLILVYGSSAKLRQIPKNQLNDTLTLLAGRICQWHKMTEHKYRQFLMDYMAYVASREEIPNATFSINPTKDSNCYTILAYNVNNIWINNRVWSKPKTLSGLCDNIESVEHEFAHLKDKKTNPFDYKKYENETGRKLQTFNEEALKYLASLLPQEYKNGFEVLHHVGYFNQKHELYARKQANDNLLALSARIKAVCYVNKFLNPTIGEEFEKCVHKTWDYYRKKTNLIATCQNYIAGKMDPIESIDKQLQLSDIKAGYDSIFKKLFIEKQLFNLENATRYDKGKIMALLDSKIFYDKKYFDILLNYFKDEKYFSKLSALEKGFYVYEVLSATDLFNNPYSKEMIESCMYNVCKHNSITDAVEIKDIFFNHTLKRNTVISAEMYLKICDGVINKFRNKEYQK